MTKPEIRLELTPRAQMIESAKELAWQIRHEDRPTRIALLKKWYPELSDEDIEKLVE